MGEGGEGGGLRGVGRGGGDQDKGGKGVGGGDRVSLCGAGAAHAPSVRHRTRILSAGFCSRAAGKDQALPHEKHGFTPQPCLRERAGEQRYLFSAASYSERARHLSFSGPS